MKYVITILMYILTTPLISADISSLFLDFLIRERFESWNGMNAKNYGDNRDNSIGEIKDNFLLQKIVAGVKYKITGNILLSAHIQDSRAFGWSLRQSEYPDLFKIHSK